jgi:hypothetical protein
MSIALDSEPAIAAALVVMASAKLAVTNSLFIMPFLPSDDGIAAWVLSTSSLVSLQGGSTGWIDQI